jgi:DivIVA domain-containing protein
VSTFPTTRKSKFGYKPADVDAFLERARKAYDGPLDDGDESMSAAEIRRTAFAMQKGGYSTAHVDSALERLEDAFAARERDERRAELGEEAWFAEARTTAQVIINRLSRDDGERFDRTAPLTAGYNRDEVDRFARRLMRYFQDGKPMAVDEVRTVVFKQQRRGYREAQVDLLLDSVVDVMLAVR